jgi:hypothetical protein
MKSQAFFMKNGHFIYNVLLMQSRGNLFAAIWRLVLSLSKQAQANAALTPWYMQ